MTTMLSTQTRTGYDFTGFYYSGTQYITRTGVLTGNWTLSENPITLIAQFTPHTYTITYVDNAGQPSMSNDTYNITEPITLATSVRNGYTFNGWNVQKNVGNWTTTEGPLSGTLPLGRYGDVTLVAAWSENTYTAEFLSVGGTTVEDIEYSVTSNPLTMPTVTKAGYTFAGWKVTTAYGNWQLGATYTIGQEVANMYGSTTEGQNVVFTAQWTANTNTAYEIHIYYQDANTGEYGSYTTVNRTGTTDQALTITYSDDGTSVTVTDSNETATYSQAGFHIDEEQDNTESATVSAGTTTVVNVYFARNTWTLTLAVGTGIDSVTPASATVLRYGLRQQQADKIVLLQQLKIKLF